MKIEMKQTLEVPPYGMMEKGKAYEVDESTASGLVADGVACREEKPVPKPKQKHKETEG